MSHLRLSTNRIRLIVQLVENLFMLESIDSQGVITSPSCHISTSQAGSDRSADQTEHCQSAEIDRFLVGEQDGLARPRRGQRRPG